MMKMNKTIIKRHAGILSKRHPAFRRLIGIIGDIDFDIPIWRNIDDAVVYAVIGQMLSNAASSSIIARLKKKISKSQDIIIWASRTANRKGPIHGVSQKKRKALRSWLEFSKNNEKAWRQWPFMPLEEYQNEITSIWGFGKWSADMIAIFYLARKDIWPETDTGINRASAVVFGIDSNENIRKYVDGCETVAALYLWELLNRNLFSDFKYNVGVSAI